MKYILALILSIALLYSHQSHAGMLSFGGETVVTVVDLPNTTDYQNEQGENVDIGYLYKSVTVLFVPIWNFEGRFVGVLEGNSSKYLNFEQQQITQIVTGANLSLPEEPILDFWNRVGGKIVFLLVVGYLGFSFYQKQQNKSHYLSDADTDEERLLDILQSSYKFSSIDLSQISMPDADGQLKPSHILIGKILTTCNLVTVFNVDRIESNMAQSTIDHYFDQLLALQKSLKVKSQQTTQYFIFINKQTPAEQTIESVLKAKKTKLTKSTNALALIVDLESRAIHARKGMYPPKKALENCFVKESQAKNAMHTTA
jgi:hypothetical protein